nr:EF-hand calcium-binding domain-containing protein 2 isoform X2 [Microcebus murinus]
MADDRDREEAVVAELHKKIKDAFEVFDHESNNTVDVRGRLCTRVSRGGPLNISTLPCTTQRKAKSSYASFFVILFPEHTLGMQIRTTRLDLREIGTIMRSLGCCPSEGELHDLIAEVEDEEPTGYIRFEKFLPVMTEILLQRRYRPVPEDILLRAFEVLDSTKRGFLTKEELVKYMTEEGEPFSQEEMEEMLSAAIDPDSNSIHYRDYITMMVIDEH